MLKSHYPVLAALHQQYRDWQTRTRDTPKVPRPGLFMANHQAGRQLSVGRIWGRLCRKRGEREELVQVYTIAFQ
jgi:hypothetical protein